MGRLKNTDLQNLFLVSESSVDFSYAPSPVIGVRDAIFTHKRSNFHQTNFPPNMEAKKDMDVKSTLLPSSFSTHFQHSHSIRGIRPSQNRVRRHFSNKERWQPLYAKPKDPETVSMFGYEFANDVIHGHVPPSALLPAPCQVNVPEGVSKLHQSPRESVIANEYTVCSPIERQAKTVSVSTQMYSPQTGAASTKLSTVSSKRSKRKMRKSRRYRDQLRHRWQRRLPVFNTGFQLGTLESYGPANNDKLSGYLGNRSYGNIVGEDGFEGALIRQRIQMSETSLLEEIWQHVKMLVERTNQELGSYDICFCHFVCVWFGFMMLSTASDYLHEVILYLYVIHIMYYSGRLNVAD